MEPEAVLPAAQPLPRSGGMHLKENLETEGRLSGFCLPRRPGDPLLCLSADLCFCKHSCEHRA